IRRDPALPREATERSLPIRGRGDRGARERQTAEHDALASLGGTSGDGAAGGWSPYSTDCTSARWHVGTTAAFGMGDSCYRTAGPRTRCGCAVLQAAAARVRESVD